MEHLYFKSSLQWLFLESRMFFHFSIVSSASDIPRFCNCRSNDFPIWNLRLAPRAQVLWGTQIQMKLWRHGETLMCMNDGTYVNSHTHIYAKFTHSHKHMCMQVLFCTRGTFCIVYPTVSLRMNFFQALLVLLIFHLFINVINNVLCYLPSRVWCVQDNAEDNPNSQSLQEVVHL